MSLLNLQGSAIRHGGQIEVNLFGQLNDSCHTAAIKGHTPGAGGIERVDITTGVKPGNHYCLLMLMPWADGIVIADKEATEVEVFVDAKSRLKLTVKDKPTRYEVYQNLNDSGCIIVPEGTPVLAIYSHAFGPASRAECEQYVAQHCGNAI